MNDDDVIIKCSIPNRIVYSASKRIYIYMGINMNGPILCLYLKYAINCIKTIITFLNTIETLLGLLKKYNRDHLCVV